MQQEIYNEYSRFDNSNQIHDTAIIYPNVTMGKNNTIGAYSVIGSNGEIRGKKQNEFSGLVVIGDNNVISEMVTIQRPFKKEHKTVIGSDNIIMAHSHIGHNVVINDNCEICTGVIIGGFATINNGAKVKLGVTVRNRIEVGENTLIGLGSAVVKNTEANSIVYGNPAKSIK